MKNFTKFLVLLLACSPAFSWAAMANIFEPATADVSLKILNQLFGGLLNIGNGNDAFGKAIETFNGAVLAVGGILAAYTVLAGTLGTAHDGEMLGKKFSSVWIPIRYSIGTALVIPISSAGYCGMQFLVMWLIVQGVGLADIVWNSYLDSPTALLRANVQNGSKEGILKFVEGLALATGCINTLEYSEGNVDSALKVSNDPKFVYSFSSYHNGQVNFGRPAPIANGITSTISNNPLILLATSMPGMVAYAVAGGLDTSNECGIANIVTIPATENDSAVDAIGGSTGYVGNGKLGSFGNAFTIKQPTSIYQAHSTEGLRALAELNNAAKAAAWNPKAKSIPYSKVKEVADNYVKAIEVAGASYIANEDPFKEIKEQSKTQGWLLAGAWFTKLTLINSHLQSAMNVVPSAEGTVKISTGLFSFPEEALDRLNIVQGEVLSKQGEYKPYDGSTIDNDKGAKDDSHTSLYNRAMQGISKTVLGFVNLDIQNLQNDTRPAVIIVQQIGSSMIDLWQGSMAAIISVAAVGMFLGGAGQAIISTILGFLMVPIGALVVIGFTLAYMLPNLPFLMWTGVVLGWIIMTIEAIIAAPLWAIMHLHPNGDDLTGRGGNGYMLLLGLILRPALTIFGLIAALVVTDLMGEFINKIFFNVFYVGDATGFRAFMVIIFAVAVYTMAMFAMFKKTFSLMHVIPDQLMQWIGGGQSQLGQYAGSLAEEAGRGVGSASVVSGFMGKGVVDGLGQAGQAKTQLNKQEKEIEQSRKNEIAQQEGNAIALQQSINSAEDAEDKKFKQSGLGFANTEALFGKANDKGERNVGNLLQASIDRKSLKDAQVQFQNAGGDPMALTNEIKAFKSNPSNSGKTNIEAISESLSSVMTRMRETGEGSLAPEAPINPISEGSINPVKNNDNQEGSV